MLRPEDLRIVISTVARQPEYVHTTLASLFASDPLMHRLCGVGLVVGGDDVSYLGPYGHHAGIDVYPLSHCDASLIRNWPTHRRFCHNYLRCLTLATGEAKGLCVCEDDVVFRDGFVSKLIRTVGEMEDEDGIAKYILACYVPYRLADDPSLRRGRYYASYFAPTFYGTQCVYYPATVLDDVAECMCRDGVENYKHPGDFIVRDYAHSINALYGTVASLVQHIGRVSTGLGRFHSSPTFADPFPEI